MIIRALAVIVAILAAASPAGAAKLKVVASFSILGDMVERVGGDKIELTTLVGRDADAHVFEPTPADARALSTSQIVFANGLGFEPWLARLASASTSRPKIVVVSKGVRTLYYHDHQPHDPHAWHDVSNASIYVRNIARALAAVDRTNAAAYFANAEAYLKQLSVLGTDIRVAFAYIPKAQRRVITTHDAFSYLGDAYDIEFVAPLGISTDAQPSAKGVARLIEQIKREKIRAVFVENISDPRLIEQIARETGAKIGGKLYSDALSTKAGPAPTYIAMMRHNVRLLTAAMAPGL